VQRSLQRTEKIKCAESISPNGKRRASDGGEGGLLVYRVHSNGFLHHMVRNLVGTFIDVGARSVLLPMLSETFSPQRGALRSRDQRRRLTALFLISVDYEDIPA